MSDKGELLGSGADDYLTKPYQLEELWARIQVQLRHANAMPFGKLLRFRDWLLDSEEMSLVAAGTPVSLTAHEFRIVELLVNRPKRVFTKQQIYEAVWQEDYAVEDKTITVHISNIRAKLRPSGILTVLGVLITLICPVLFGMRLTAAPVIALLQYTFWLWLPHWAFGLLALALVLLTRNSTLGILMAVISGGGVTAAVLQLVCRQLNWPPLDQYLLSSVEGSQCIPMLGAQQMGMILACTLGWAAVYGIGSLLLIEKRDI